jgi:hypothetical protein
MKLAKYENEMAEYPKTMRMRKMTPGGSKKIPEQK